AERSGRHRISFRLFDAVPDARQQARIQRYLAGFRPVARPIPATFWRMRLAFAVLIPLAFLSPARAEPDRLSEGDMKHFAPDAVQLGWKYFQQGDYETALRRFQMAIRHDPDFAPAYFGAANVYSAEGKVDEAIKYYRETLKKDTLYVFTYVFLRYALATNMNIAESLKVWVNALELDPT